jgi:antitoxin CcdA
MFKESPMPQATVEKQRTNITLTAANLAAARELGLNVSAISDAAVAEAVRAAKSEAWARENAEAIAERRAWIEANGTPLADLQVLKIG